MVRKEPPPYGRRKGWIPRSLEDYGDGGAFPEIHVAQYPLNMGKKKATVSTSDHKIQHVPTTCWVCRHNKNNIPWRSLPTSSG